MTSKKQQIIIYNIINITNNVIIFLNIILSKYLFIYNSPFILNCLSILYIIMFNSIYSCIISNIYYRRGAKILKILPPILYSKLVFLQSFSDTNLHLFKVSLKSSDIFLIISFL